MMDGILGGVDAADAESYYKKIKMYAKPKKVPVNGVNKMVDYKVAAVTSDSASVMVKARNAAAEKLGLVAHACKFHSTDLAGGRIINSIDWLKQAVADACFIASVVKRRSRVLNNFNAIRERKNVAFKKRAAKEAAKAFRKAKRLAKENDPARWLFK